MSAAPPAARVSVIVLTFNSSAEIEGCLSAVLRQDYPEFEVIVVDNASCDGTPELVAARFPSVRLIRSPRNDGWGAGNNLGAAQARGDVLVFLNPDTVAEPDWLSCLIGTMQQRNRQFATSKITLPGGARLNSSGNWIHYLGLSSCRGVNAPRSAFSVPELVPGASGAAFAISRALFDRLGGFDPTLFLNHDDVDLSLRALLAGHQCLYVPDAVVAHDYTPNLSPQKWEWIEAYRYVVLLKLFSLRTLLLLVPALLAMDLVTLAYLASQGPRFVLAKLRSYAWLVRHVAGIHRGRRQAQALRALSDREVLSALVDEIPYEQVAGRRLRTIAQGVLDPWFRAYRHLSLVAIRW